MRFSQGIKSSFLKSDIVDVGLTPHDMRTTWFTCTHCQRTQRSLTATDHIMQPCRMSRISTESIWTYQYTNNIPHAHRMHWIFPSSNHGNASRRILHIQWVALSTNIEVKLCSAKGWIYPADENSTKVPLKMAIFVLNVQYEARFCTKQSAGTNPCNIFNRLIFL